MICGEYSRIEKLTQVRGYRGVFLEKKQSFRTFGTTKLAWQARFGVLSVSIPGHDAQIRVDVNMFQNVPYSRTVPTIIITAEGITRTSTRLVPSYEHTITRKSHV